MQDDRDRRSADIESRARRPSYSRTRSARAGPERHGDYVEYETRRSRSRPRQSQAREESQPPRRRSGTRERVASRRKRRQYWDARYGRSGTAYVEEVAPSTEQTPDQDSDDVLDDVYGGQADDVVDIEYEMPEARIYSHDEQGATYYDYQGEPAQPTVEKIDIDVGGRMYGRSRPMKSTPGRYEEIKITSSREDFLRSPPEGYRNKGLWRRAALVPNQIDTIYPPPIGRHSPRYDDSLSLPLKLVLTRRGERYKGRSFSYTRGTWNDRQLAVHLQQEYRSLKAQSIGWLQKLTSYRRIAFIYFLQYHAYPSRAHRGGFWKISNRVSITPLDDEIARSSFMYKLGRLVREGRRRSQRKGVCSRDWISRLDQLIEPGAVIDIEVKETFDTVKIYIFSALSVLLSLGAALAYGFATPDQDFATGFGIASWLITAFAFLLAVIVGGEWLGLEKPGASMTAVELSSGAPLDKELLEYRRSRY